MYDSCNILHILLNIGPRFPLTMKLRSINSQINRRLLYRTSAYHSFVFTSHVFEIKTLLNVILYCQLVKALAFGTKQRQRAHFPSRYIIQLLFYRSHEP